MFSVLAFIVVFGIVVLVHEGGHFLAAKAVGIGVYEFSIGFGKNLFSKKFGKTVFKLNLVPLGGLVKLAGLDVTKRVPAKENYFNKPVWAKLLTIVSGALSNFILAIIIFSLVFMLIGVPQGISNKIMQVLPSSAAQKAGMQKGDTIVSFNGTKVTDMQKVVKQINRSQGKKLSFIVQRGKSEQLFYIKPDYNTKEKKALIGIMLKPLYQRPWPHVALYTAVLNVVAIIKSAFMSLGLLFTGGFKQLGGPVAIAKLSGIAAQSGMLTFINFIAFISINIGILNLLPLPALDGGRAIFLIAEAVTRKPINKNWENSIHWMGFLLLLILMLFITFNDINRIIGN